MTQTLRDYKTKISNKRSLSRWLEKIRRQYRSAAKRLPDVTKNLRSRLTDRGVGCKEAAVNDDLRINETEGLNGGYPCVGNTRIAVRFVAQVFQKTDDVDKTAEKFPQLTREQVVAAIEYFITHPARVNEDIDRNQRTLVALSAR